MFSTIKKTFSPSYDSSSHPHQGNLSPETVIKVDSFGFVEFPSPDDVSKQLLPILKDPEEEEAMKLQEFVSENVITNHSEPDNDFKEYWMPDRLCKVCYSCEDSFSMFRRRHHCRMCGQVFCNPCSSYYIDGTLINLQGLVRCCKLCYEQMDRETKSSIKKRHSTHVEQSISLLASSHTDLQAIAKGSNEPVIIANRRASRSVDTFKQGITGGFMESQVEKIEFANILQNRASSHLEAIIKLLVEESTIKVDKDMWELAIISLIREVVSSVDPNVKEGDSIDIRDYVKLKIIPGGAMEESIFIDGVVFRKNVSHKKMMYDKIDSDPKILLLSGGIDFQRMDTKLSSMDTLIEQEDKYMEILVEKIMSLKPDLILVGKSVARRAQELFCKYKVVVMQNVKLNLLERISRMTGAKVLPSTDHMIQQSGHDCLGTCRKFSLRIIQDDPEKMDQQKSKRILRSRIARGTTYAYIEGCPSEKGCTIVLRGGNRDVLNEVHRILNFGIIIAYHLRLEVAYYSDRCAILPLLSSSSSLSDSMDHYDDSDDDYMEIFDEMEGVLHKSTSSEERSITSTTSSNNSVSHSPTKGFHGNFSNGGKNLVNLRRKDQRYLLSTSLDVDFSLPYSTEIRGANRYKVSKPNIVKTSPTDHQMLVVTSILMHDTTQRSKSEIKRIKYYTSQDLSLGQFLIENCFNASRNVNRETSMLDQTLSFIHRPGRIEISVVQLNNGPIVDESITNSTSGSKNNPMNIPINMSSFCKECGSLVLPENPMSDETWKMSFGKFLEISFYNRTAKCRLGKCSHYIRDDHILMFSTEHYAAKFVFIPIHPYSLYVRHMMEFQPLFHMQYAFKILTVLPQQCAQIVESFRRSLYALASEAKEVFSGGQNGIDEYQVVLADINAIDVELQSAVTALSRVISVTLSSLPKNIVDISIQEDDSLPLNKLSQISTISSRQIKTIPESREEELEDEGKEIEKENDSDDDEDKDHNKEGDHQSNNNQLTGSEENLSPDYSDHSKFQPILMADNIQNSPSRKDKTKDNHHISTITEWDHDNNLRNSQLIIDDSNLDMKLKYPMFHRRQVYIQMLSWNSRIHAITKYLETTKESMIQQQQRQQQQQQQQQLPSMSVTNPSSALLYSTLGSFAQNESILNDVDKEMVDVKPSTTHLSPVLPTSTTITAGTTTIPTISLESPSLPDPSKVKTERSNSSECHSIDQPVYVRAMSDSRTESSESIDSEKMVITSTIQESEELEPAISNTISVASLVPSPVPAIPIVSSISSVSIPSNTTLSSNTGSEKKSIIFELPGSLAFEPISNLSTPLVKSEMKPQAKPNRLTKALARFVMGKDNTEEEEKRFEVNLGLLGEGRLGMPAGRKGEVIHVSDDEPATIIAYSLASMEYYELLQEFMREDYEDLDSEEDFENSPQKMDVGNTKGSYSTSAYVSRNQDSRNKLVSVKGIEEEEEEDDEDEDDDEDVEEEEVEDVEEVDVYEDGMEEVSSDKIDNSNIRSNSNNNSKDTIEIDPDKFIVQKDKDTTTTAITTTNNSNSSRENTPKKPSSPHSPAVNHTRSKRLAKSKIRTTAVSKALANATSSNNFSSIEEQSFTTFSVNEPTFHLDDNIDSNHYISVTISTSNSNNNNNNNNTTTITNNANITPIGTSSSQSIEGSHTNPQNSDDINPPVFRLLSIQSDSISSDISANIINSNHQPITTTSAINNNQPTNFNTNTNINLTMQHNSTNSSSYGYKPSSHISKMEESRRHQLEKQLLSQRKSHIKHRFEDHDEKGNVTCKFQCQTYWATQFEAVRAAYLNEDENEHFIRSLSLTKGWNVKGGKSGASFSKSLDDRFVIKVINRVEMQMFLDFAPAYFEYMVKAFFHNLPTVLCKIMGVYTVGYHNRETGKKVTENVVVMENMFYQRNITGIFDLKGSSRARYLEVTGEKALSFDEAISRRRRARRYGLPLPPRITSSQVLLDDNLMELTKGRPFPLKHRAKVYFTKAVTNDTLFLRMIDVVDYSILVGFDDDSHEVVVGIIDYLRKYDIVKKMERMGKTVGMLTGQAEPTIIQPPQYRNRFQQAMDRYFMTVPDKWVAHDG